MYRIFKSEEKNCLLLRMRGLITEEEAIRLIQELTASMRSMRKDFGLCLDMRELSPRTEDNADFMVKSALRIMAIKKPAMVARIALPIALMRMDRIYAETQLPVTFKVKNATSMKGMLALLTNHRLEVSKTLAEWILTLPEDIEKNLLGENDAPANNKDSLPEMPPFIRGFSITGNPVRHELIRIEVDTDQDFYDTPYTFEFAYRRQSPSATWNLMPKTDKNHSRNCRFEDAGEYEIYIRITRNQKDFTNPLLTELRIPIYISPVSLEKRSRTQAKKDTDFPAKGQRCFLLLNKNTTDPHFLKTIIYEVNMDTQMVVIAQTSPALKSLKSVDSLDLVSTDQNHPEDGRPGLQILSLEALSRYILPDGQAREALMLRFTLPIRQTGLRSERKAYRCSCQPYTSLMAGKIRFKDTTFTSKNDFRFNDISMTGIGLKFPPGYETKLPDTGNTFLLELFFEAVEGTLADIHINAEIKLVRKKTDSTNEETSAGFTFSQLDADHETLLARHINAIQLLERQRLLNEKRS
ncbi:PilZ domain-containing protein [Desulfobotulus mexicanus]|uniref:PilZ domain-containing protein n=1 Tax=Desulfobotulus mexicanus TaxID=2586642 RepID=A0A5S5MDZ3_9BACT|nr:PilZ domain-containing protein [Desulfobotulus mexicanus]TYT73933.1 PilZ domain-containing protein [Desulfobotulus mexicanus]